MAQFCMLCGVQPAPPPGVFCPGCKQIIMDAASPDELETP